MEKVKTIGVLTSGGDSPGMNACIRSIVRYARHNDIKVMGIKKGYNGLITGDMYEMNTKSVSDIIQRGGTMLQTARCAEFRKEEGVNKAVEMIKIFGLDGLIVIGGDGSFRGARDLSLKGVPTIGVPGTIDNDISCTEYTIGFDTALNTVAEAIDKIRDTSSSHERCTVIEVMGAGSGYIALYCGIANGAEVVILPEKEFNFEKDVLKPIIDGHNRGKNHYIVIVAEKITNVIEMAKQIESKTGIETRASILGHIQRGGSPTVRDRVVASMMGKKAVDLLKDGIGNRVVVQRNNEITDLDILEGLDMKKEVSSEMIELCNILSE